MNLGLYNGTWYTEHYNGTSFLAISQIVMECDKSLTTEVEFDKLYHN